jgi:hypothetical protein
MLPPLSLLLWYMETICLSLTTKALLQLMYQMLLDPANGFACSFQTRLPAITLVHQMEQHPTLFRSMGPPIAAK